MEADRGATEYRLHRGDVLWWDFREWEQVMRAPVVVGAFPEPFLHGFGGETLPAVVRYGGAELADGARAIGRLIRARSVAPMTTPVPENANLFVVAGGGRPGLVASLRDGATGPGDPVVFTFVGDPARLARNPRLVRYRYRWQP
jgi:predicted Rossmann-fold nucleotide-binding protein